MEKVYLLLRNNQQSGPYTIDELLQQQLTSKDMLWIAGKSTAWCYLSEMELKPAYEAAVAPEVKSELTADPTNRAIPSPNPVIPEKNIARRRSSPHDEIENKAEELRKRALTFKPQYELYQNRNIAADREQSRPIQMLEDEIDFIDHRNEKKLPVVEVLTGILVAAFVFASIIGGRNLFIEKPGAPVPRVAAQVLSTDEHAAKAQPIVTSPVAFQNPQPVDSLTLQVPKKPRIKKLAENTVMVAAAEENTITNQDVSNAASKTEEVVTMPPVNKPPVEDDKKTEEQVKKEPAQEPAHDNSVAEKPEKKKGFLKNLFRKKKDSE